MPSRKIASRPSVTGEQETMSLRSLSAGTGPRVLRHRTPPSLRLRQSASESCVALSSEATSTQSPTMIGVEPLPPGIGVLQAIDDLGIVVGRLVASVEPS